jgi:AcrR family transcriptional regulator
MRITSEAKSVTQERIRQAAASLLVSQVWRNTTTRDIAVAVGIATGALFHYFATKEGIAVSLVGKALERAGEEFRASRKEGDSLEADLFSLIWSGLGCLRDFRKFLAPGSETIFSPLSRQFPERLRDGIRADHLELEEETIAAQSMQLYWTLYLGVFAHWAADDSPGQEDTLALLDQSLKLSAVSACGRGRGTHGRKSMSSHAD